MPVASQTQLESALHVVSAMYLYLQGVTHLLLTHWQTETWAPVEEVVLGPLVVHESRAVMASQPCMQ